MDRNTDRDDTGGWRCCHEHMVDTMVTHFWHLPFVPWERSRPVRMNGRRTYDPEADGVETENANIRVLNSSQTWPARIWTRSIMHTLDDTRTNADQSPPHFEHGEHGNTTKVTAMFANDRSMTSTTVVRVYIYIYLYIHCSRNIDPDFEYRRSRAFFSIVEIPSGTDRPWSGTHGAR